MSSCHKLLRIKLINGKVKSEFVYGCDKISLHCCSGKILFKDIKIIDKKNKIYDISDINGNYYKLKRGKKY